MKHTKGTQYIKASGPGFEDVFTYPSEVDGHSLISAAPEMLEALEELVMFYKEVDSDNYHYIDKAVNVIKKAKGDDQ